MIKLVLTIKLLCFYLFLEGQYDFVINPRLEEAYDLIVSLRMEEAQKLLSETKQHAPNNLMPYFFENYIDFLTVFVHENENEFKVLEKNKECRLNSMSKGDKKSPYYLYTQAEIRIQWAIVRIKFGEYLRAFNELSIAYSLLKKNAKLFPDFILNKKSMGVLHTLVGALPDQYKWGVKLFGGLDGTVHQGMFELKEVLEYASKTPFLFEQESLLLYVFLLVNMNYEAPEAWEIIHLDQLRPEDNPLHAYIGAMTAKHQGDGDRAVSILKSKPQTKAYLSFPYLDYMLGDAKLNRLDKDADVYFQKYLQTNKGNFLVKEAYQKLAWNELVQGNIQGYEANMKKCLNEGSTIHEKDKKALQNAQNGKIPNITLLKARLLFDGGYLYQAHALLQGKSQHSFENSEEKTEFFYRQGRIFHKLEEFSKATFYYNETIRLGEALPRYFACNAAFQLGLIYEGRGQKALAEESFERCLDMKPEEYRESLHQKAKVGLERLKK